MRTASVFVALVMVASVSVMAQDRGRSDTNRRRTAPRPQTSTARTVNQGARRTTSPAPGQTRVSEQNAPRGRRGSDRAVDRRSDRAVSALEGQQVRRGNGRTDRGQRNNQQPEGRGPATRPGARGTESPRQAMERNLNKRLSQIDKIRDRALETGDLDLLDFADRLELDARRKFDAMVQRLATREQVGRPGVGPRVEIPAGGQTRTAQPRVARSPQPQQDAPPTTRLPNASP